MGRRKGKRKEGNVIQGTNRISCMEIAVVLHFLVLKNYVLEFSV